MRKILVTGGNGFIGEYVCNNLVKQGHKVFVLGKKRTADTPFQYYSANLLDKDRIISILNSVKPDIVIHMAAIAAVTHDNIGELYEVNVVGTENLLDSIVDANLQGTRFVFISTAGVYGNQEISLLNENLPTYPSNHYSRSKLLCEIMLNEYNRFMDVRVIRPFNIIGEGQKDNFLVPKLVNSFANNKEIIRVGNIETLRDYVDVKYCAKIISEVALNDDYKENTPMNICTGKGTSGIDIVNMLVELTGRKVELIVEKSFSRTHEVEHLIGNPEKLNHFLNITDLNLKPRTVYEIVSEMLAEKCNNQ